MPSSTRDGPRDLALSSHVVNFTALLSALGLPTTLLPRAVLVLLPRGLRTRSVPVVLVGLVPGLFSLLPGPVRRAIRRLRLMCRGRAPSGPGPRPWPRPLSTLLGLGRLFLSLLGFSGGILA